MNAVNDTKGQSWHRFRKKTVASEPGKRRWLLSMKMISFNFKLFQNSAGNAC
jgi:hypothetical protein